MKAPTFVPNEAARLRRLRRSHLLDTVTGDVLDGFTRIAARLTGRSLAVISLIEEDRQCVKSQFASRPQSLLPPVIPRHQSLCAQVILQPGQLFEVEDARRDPRFRNSPVVQGSPGVVHYAGVALVMPEGEAVGTLSVAGCEPGRLDPLQGELLQELASQVVQLLLLREQERNLERDRLLHDAVDLSELAPAGVYAMDANGMVLHANRYWAALLGAAEVEEVLADGWTAFVHPEDLPRVQQLRRAGMTDGRPYMHLYRTRASSYAQQKWIRTRVAPADPHLSPVAFVGAAVDVTQMRELEAALQQKNRLLETIIAHLPCGLTVMDDGLQPLLSNEAARLMLGEELASFEADGVDAAAVTRRLAASDRIRIGKAVRSVRDPAEASTVEVRGATLPGGGVIATFTDVTAARRASRELQVSQGRLARALQASGLGLWEFDVGAGRVFLSASCARLLDMGDVDTEAAPGDLLALLPREGAGALAAARRQLLRGERNNASLEHAVLRGPGMQPRWLLTSAQVSERSADGSPVKIVGTCQDISARQAADAELRQALDAADGANRAKSDFLATMSHEIRTPLNGVIGLAKLLSGADLPPLEQRSVEMLQGCARSLLSVVDNILDFSKIEAGHLTLEETPSDLSALLQELGDVFRVSAAEKGIGFELAIGPGLPRWVAIDAARLRQVLLNLLGNALKFTEKGKFSLGVHQEEAAAGTMLRFEVADTGIGIPAPAQQRLFTRFTQAHGASGRQYGGTGLGLAISRQLAHLMHGDVSLESTPGVGSTFTLRIPLKPTKPAEETGRNSPRTAGGQSSKILVAEDNEVNQHVARRMLELIGYEDVAIVPDGEAALRMCEGQHFDLILMDCQMPILDGRAATVALRRAGVRTPVIALTAAATAEDRDACLKAGMDDYIAKPFELAVLADKLQQWIGRAGTPAPIAVQVRARAGMAPAFDPAAVARYFAGDEQCFRQVRDIFIGATPQRLGELAAALGEARRESASAIAHKVRGGARTVGADRLAQLCQQIEDGGLPPGHQAAWEQEAHAALEAFVLDSDDARLLPPSLREGGPSPSAGDASQ